MQTAFVGRVALGLAACIASSIAVAADECRFDLYRVPDAGLGNGAALAAPAGRADGVLDTGSSFPDTTKAPYTQFRQLDTLVNRINRYCTAQVVGRPDVLLTAAHCVRDNGNGAWVEDFQLRQPGGAAQTPQSNPKCIVTNRNWVGRLPDGFGGRFYWPADYALIVMPAPVSTEFFQLKADVPAPVDVSAFGLPVGVGRHERLVEIPGKAAREKDLTTMGTTLHKQRDAKLGMSGGAWITSLGSESGSGTVVGLSTTVFEENGTFLLAGPYFDACAAAMLKFVEDECH